MFTIYPLILTIHRRFRKKWKKYDRLKKSKGSDTYNIYERRQTMKKIVQFILKNGGRLCAFAVGVASIAPLCCRGNWYQPEEPEGLETFMKGQ